MLGKWLTKFNFSSSHACQTDMRPSELPGLGVMTVFFVDINVWDAYCYSLPRASQTFFE